MHSFNLLWLLLAVPGDDLFFYLPIYFFFKAPFITVTESKASVGLHLGAAVSADLLAAAHEAQVNPAADARRARDGCSAPPMHWASRVWCSRIVNPRLLDLTLRET